MLWKYLTFATWEMLYDQIQVQIQYERKKLFG